MVSTARPTSKDENPKPNEAVALQLRYEALYDEGRYDEAIPLAEKACRLFKDRNGPISLDVADCSGYLGVMYNRQARYADAETMLERSLLIRERLDDPESIELAKSLGNLAVLRINQGKLEDAQALLQRSLDIRERALGGKHPGLVGTLDNLAALSVKRGRYREAERLLSRALDIQVAELGEHAPDTTTLQNNLGMLYRIQGNHALAESLLQDALEGRVKTLGARHPDTVITVMNLAGLRREQGRLAEAEELAKEALAIRIETLGAEHPSVAVGLEVLAQIKTNHEDYDEAEALLRRALLIREKTQSADHPDVATTMSMIANLLYLLGDHESSIAFERRALAIKERTLGPNHPNIGASLNSLAIAYEEQRRYDDAEALKRRALSIAEASLGSDNLQTATSMNNLGELLRLRGQFEQARDLHERALMIRKRLAGPRHPVVAGSLTNLAGLHMREGEPAAALPLLTEALSIWKEALGEEHATVANVLRRIGTVYLELGRLPEALGSFEQAADLDARGLVRVSLAANDRRNVFFAKRLVDSSNQVFSLQLQHATDALEAQASRLGFQLALRRKGFAAHMSMRSQLVLLRLAASEAHHVLNDLVDVQARYSTLANRGPGSGPVDAHRTRLAALERQQDELWAELREVSPPFRALTTPITISAVQAQLPGDSALVEYVRYRAVFGPGTSKGTNELRYAAYILFPHRLDWVDLGPAAPIDAQIQAFRNDIILGTDVHASGRALHDSVMKPVIDRLGGVDHLFVAPDADLNLVPFDALVDEHSRFLVERFRLHTLTSGRDLLRPWMLEPAADGPVVVVANPAGADLPGTEHEATQLASLFHDTVRLQHDDATETRLRTHERPRILHLATHGTFASGRPGHTLLDAPPDDLLPTGTSVFDGLPPSQLDNPMLYSWLDLTAPAATPDGEPDEHADLDDGKLTAYEISGWDLRGTELVTLSACDTAQGTYQQGEGILGLRRAFAIAGAQTQVMSLWKVSDASTTALMATYYRRLLAGEGRSEAMRNTQLERLRNPETRHPRDWAAFVVIGEWGPLSHTTREGPEPIPPRPRGCQASVEPNVDALGSLALALVGLGTIRRRRRATGPEQTHM